ncbi:cytidine deaminase-like protein [Lineolata rhizophorae]|uniref:Cytidine deaminase n=1 Tax=Lineolata rhizophorae TaxID=578093 RepID=A0A6A6NYV4_9PEZI|nr:cytidine deaminase-like protein [Lineolata rhizophorae]
MLAAKAVEASSASAGSDGLIHGLTAQEVRLLTKESLDARSLAYCPYSKFHVGATLLTRDGNFISGANVENASYPVGTCAERVAMSSAIMKGYRMGSFKAVGVATNLEEPCSPCGMCRQFLREFCELSTPVFLHDKHGQYIVRTLGELLPMSFGPEHLAA